MFESLTEKFVRAFRHVAGTATLSERNIDAALQEAKEALLSADVNYRVVEQFISDVKGSCLGQDVLKSVSPGQQFIKVINDALIKLFGEGSTELSTAKPLKMMLVGLHGAGKTTTIVKLAKLLRDKGYKPVVVACDVYRPAAIDQLATLAQQNDILCYKDRGNMDVCRIAVDALTWAKLNTCDAVLFDTAGRLQIDTKLIDEIQQLKKIVRPEEVLLVADGALGQEAVNVAQKFHEAVQLTGAILTKLDGDARGGAALSMKAATGVSIKFVGVGEKIDALDKFHPDRMAQRLLGMGDVVSLVEKAKAQIGEQESERLAKKIASAHFDLWDFYEQLNQIGKLGSLSGLMQHMPGLSGFKVGDREDQHVQRMQAIILSMTKEERANANVINGNRRLRIAKGAGLEVKDVNQVLKFYLKMKTFMDEHRGQKSRKMMDQVAKFTAGFGKNPFLMK